uniref:HAUS augmin-like complex subunit 3 n=1 Tax=Doryrhamphus excisus TaxID=161450 RepID=UPI0025AE65E4|nr:HAUS augmin-like complex subunit 3 [Doryrhamphus excisus]
MLNGRQFVEAMGRLGYPDASSLKAHDFDWLFNCSPENLHFLRFVCRSLNRANVLTLEEARDFQELSKSGRPILDEAALGEVLKTIGPSEENSATSMFAAETGVALEDLELELRELKKEKELKQQRYRKLQVAATSRADIDFRLIAESESAASKLTEVKAFLGAENADTNTVLQSLTDEVNRLASHLSVQPEAKHREKRESFSRRPTALLSQLSLDPFLHQEELNTKTLSAFTRRHFFTGISDIVETSCSFQLLDLSSCESGEKENEQSVVDQRRTQMARLQWSHIVAQHQLIQTTAEEKSIKAGIDWLAEKSSCKSISNSSLLQVREVVSRKELQVVEAELEALLHGPVPAALRESARLLNVPVVKGDLALQLARQNYITSRQDQVRDVLLRQKASFDIVLLAQEVELRNWKACLKHLSDMSSRLVEEGEAVSLRMQTLGNSELAVNTRPSHIISCKDAAVSRLLRILDSTQGAAEPFQSFEALDKAACDLANSLQVSRDALAAASWEQNYSVAQLEGHCEALHRAMYTEFQQLVLGPHACSMAITDQEMLCPNLQEMTKKLAGAESQLHSLQQVMQEIMSQVKAKRSQLERNSLLRQERVLYIYFHLDARLLRKVVEDLENKMKLRSGQQ